MRWRDASAAALFLALCGDAAAANIFHADGIDPRRFVDPGDPDQRRLAPVGAIASDFVLKDKRGFGGVAPGAGTAFLVSPCYTLNLSTLEEVMMAFMARLGVGAGDPTAGTAGRTQEDAWHTGD